MSDNKKKKTQPAPSSDQQYYQPDRVGTRSTTIIAVATLLITVLVLGAVWGVIAIIQNRSAIAFDYLTEDLAKYITLSESDYRGYEIDLDYTEVTDAEVEDRIIKLLAENKGKTIDGDYARNRPIKAGDKAYIWYFGYQKDENGDKIGFSGGSNFWSANPTELVVGSGSFIPGFELGLIDKVGNDTSWIEKVKLGKVKDNDIVYITMTYVIEDEEENGGIHGDETVRIDLSDPRLEEKWGEGFRSVLDDMDIGLTELETLTLRLKGSDNYITYTSMKIDFVTRCEEKCVTLDVVFPYDYKDESLRNKQAFFDVYIEKTLNYNAVEYNDEFVSDVLKLDAAALADYEGEGLAEKYRSKLHAELVAARDVYYDGIAEELMWEHLKSKAVVKSYPKNEIDRVFDNYYFAREMEFASSYTTQYASLDAYICSYYSLESTADWQKHMRGIVEEETKEKLIFYSILKAENLVPTDEQYPEIYRKELIDDFAFYGKTRADFASDAEFEEALADYEEYILDYYGEEFYRETVYYNYASGIILGFATINKN